MTNKIKKLKIKRLEHDEGLTMEKIMAAVEDRLTNFAGNTRVQKGYIQSKNYETGVAGYRLDAQGNIEAMSLTLIGGTARFGKTSFTDTTNAGWYLGSEGVFFGNAGDTKHWKYTIGTGVIDHKGPVLTGLQAGSDVDGQYLTALSVTAASIANATITGAKIDSATITASNIAALTITAAEIDDLTIVAGKIANSTITGGKVAANTITGGASGNIALTSITADNIAVGTITATQIAATTITGTEIASLNITSKTITADTGTVGGWTLSSTTLANGNDIILDASNKRISINDSTFGNQGIQLDYNSGTPRSYVGDGSNNFSKFDGTAQTFGGVVIASQLQKPNGEQYAITTMPPFFSISPEMFTLNAAAETNTQLRSYYVDDGNYFVIVNPGADDVVSVADMTSGGDIESRGTGSDWASANSIRGVAKIGSFLYVHIIDSPFTASRVYRYAAQDLASGGTLMTVSGTALGTTAAPTAMCSDGTSLWFNNNGGDTASNRHKFREYTISGTILTSGSTVTNGATDANFTDSAMDSSGNFYGDDGGGIVRRHNSSGTLQATSTVRVWRPNENGGTKYSFEGVPYVMVINNVVATPEVIAFRRLPLQP